MADDFNLLIPAIVHFNLGSSAVQITDYRMAITISNGCKYVNALNEKGKGSYALHKAGEINQVADIEVSVHKTNDKKFDDDIKKLEAALDKTKENDPKKYVENMLFSIATNDDKPFAHIQFQGYISDMHMQQGQEHALEEITAKLEIYDPVSFVIKK